MEFCSLVLPILPFSTRLLLGHSIVPAPVILLVQPDWEKRFFAQETMDVQQFSGAFAVETWVTNHVALKEITSHFSDLN